MKTNNFYRATLGLCLALLPSVSAMAQTGKSFWRIENCVVDRYSAVCEISVERVSSNAFRVKSSKKNFSKLVAQTDAWKAGH